MRGLTFVMSVLLLPASQARAQFFVTPASASTYIGSSSSTLVEQLAYIPDFTLPLSSAMAEVTEEEVADLEESGDTEADIFISSGMANAPEPENLGGNGSLTLTRQDTGERITAHYRAKDGSYDAEELKRIDHIMRCSLTGRETPIAVKLVELLDSVEDKFGKRGLTLLSGYRTPKLNRRLPGAAEHSLHMMGWAADIKIPGYSSTRIKSFALKKAAGGVGYYPNKGFTHLDVGKKRYWVVRRAPRRHRRLKRARSAPARSAAAKPGRGRAAVKNRSKKS
jgi:uncharacterized protein YcbK (DUF882 family)